jgi:formylglycine-generating enzyme
MRPVLLTVLLWLVIAGLCAKEGEDLFLVKGSTFVVNNVEISVSSFWIDRYETTQARYFEIMDTLPVLDHGKGDNLPVYNVSWFDAIEYCNHRSLMEGFQPCYSYGEFGTLSPNWPVGWKDKPSNCRYVKCNWTAHGYRLPTEMEWLFAARGGVIAGNYIYSGSDEIEKVAWFAGDLEPDLNGEKAMKANPVGGKLPNELCLYDMSGNIYEWCWDGFDDLPTTFTPDPHGAYGTIYRVIKGGSWATDGADCAILSRDYYDTGFKDYDLGFRVVRTQ